MSAGTTACGIDGSAMLLARATRVRNTGRPTTTACLTRRTLPSTLSTLSSTYQRPCSHAVVSHIASIPFMAGLEEAASVTIRLVRPAGQARTAQPLNRPPPAVPTMNLEPSTDPSSDGASSGKPGIMSPRDDAANRRATKMQDTRAASLPPPLTEAPAVPGWRSYTCPAPPGGPPRSRTACPAAR